MFFSAIVDTAQNTALPAPHWFIQFFKALGFTLHAVPMNLWYAGLLIALFLHFSHNQHARTFAVRLINQMPIIIAAGINLGIVPLLFIQVAYFRFFYPATILMAWYWLAIMILLIPAYYGVYLYTWGLRQEKGTGPICATTNAAHRCPPPGRDQPSVGARKLDLSPFPAWRRAAGWIAAIFFIAIGFLFANGLSLMDHIDRWGEIFNKHNVANAALGTGLNVGDPTFWPRWLLMFGLAIGTTAVWILVDMEFFHTGATEDYKRWAWRFAKVLYTVSLVWVATIGSHYVFASWNEELRKTMFAWPLIVLTVLTGMATGLPWIMIVTEKLCPAKRPLVAGIFLSQVVVLAINAVSRQVVQNINIGAAFDVFSQKIDVQWGPMIMFLILFVLGLGVLAWMIAQVIKAHGETASGL
jgi:hypothetical protein